MALGFDNFDDLAETIADYAHREDLLQRVKDLFIPLAGVRIGRDLESSANEKTEILDGTVLPNPLVLPSDFGRIRSISYDTGRGGRFTLVARDNVSINTLPDSGGDPFAYNIQDGAVDIRPFTSRLFDLNYYAIPELSDAEPANAVLARHPQVYLYGALVELQIWAQDAEQRSLALDAYRGEIQLTNRTERRARMNAPQAVGM